MSYQVVHLRVNDAETRQPTPVRLLFRTPDGRYLAPLGRPAEFSTERGVHVGGQVLIAGKPWSYIDGTCEIRLPDGPFHVEIAKGPEYEPIRTTVNRGPGQISMRWEIQRRADHRLEGWCAGDTGAHFLSPAAACLEGAAEGLDIVHLLARQETDERGTWLPGLMEFSGQEPALSRHGCVTFVNTQNQGGEHGVLSLLQCHRVVHPLTLAEPGFEKYTLADWCNQCHRKGGLVIWPRFPHAAAGQAGAALDQGLIDAVEWTSTESFCAALPEWYARLNRGQRIPLVGGSGKDSNGILLGAVRTYARLQPGEAFSGAAWIEAVRAGRTLATRGPWINLLVQDEEPSKKNIRVARGTRVKIAAGSTGGAEGDHLQVICNGEVLIEGASDPSGAARIETEWEARSSGWIAARRQRGEELLAHTSAVYVGVVS